MRIIAALPTAFRSGAPAPECWEALLLRLAGQGCRDVLGLGLTGEYATLSSAEWRTCAEALAPASVACGVELTLNVTAPSAVETLERYDRAAALGVPRVMLQIPAAPAPLSRQLDYFAPVLRRGGPPVALYINDAGAPLPHADKAAVIRQAIQEFGVSTLKYTTDDLFSTERLIAANPGLRVMHGRDETLALGLALGAAGAMGSTYCVFMPGARALAAAMDQGDLATAIQWQHRLNDGIAALLGGDRSIFEGLKTALGLLGCEFYDTRLTAGGDAAERSRRIGTFLNSQTGLALTRGEIAVAPVAGQA